MNPFKSISQYTDCSYFTKTNTTLTRATTTRAKTLTLHSLSNPQQTHTTQLQSLAPQKCNTNPYQVHFRRSPLYTNSSPRISFPEERYYRRMQQSYWNLQIYRNNNTSNKITYNALSFKICCGCSAVIVFNITDNLRFTRYMYSTWQTRNRKCLFYFTTVYLSVRLRFYRKGQLLTLVLFF